MTRGEQLRLAIAGLAVLASSQAIEAAASPAGPAHPPAIRLEFDYSAAQRMIEAIDRPALSEAEARALLENRGIAAMVAKTAVFSPASTPQGFVADMQSFVATHRYPEGDFALDWIYKYRDQVRTLVSEMRADEDARRDRITTRLTRYAPRTGPLTIKVYFVAGGMSDGFVLDGDPELALFVALEKASGDVDGVEQNVTHELYHVLQKASAAKTAGAVKFAAQLDRQPPLQKLLATTLWEGTANLAADARETPGQGPYVSMWRDRYIQNLTPEKIRENFQLFDSVLVDLEQRKIDWDAAYRRGFSGSRLYFVGMEMARSLGAARGARYFEELFVRPPTRFFRDYLQLCAGDPSLPRFSADTRRVIEHLPASW
jgi:putative zinc-dependent peptidase DUF5700